jgi:thymidylate kinase
LANAYNSRKRLIIIDRLFLSEYIYGVVFRNNVFYDFPEMDTFFKDNVKLMIICSQEENEFLKMNGNKKNFKELAKINSFFKNFEKNSKIVEYD